MTTNFKPMLACPLLPSDIESTDSNVLAAMKELRFPVLASLKIDGVRALRLNGTLLSRTLKAIPNISIRQRSLILPGGFDMELFNPEMNYNDIQGIVMSAHHKDEDKIQFHILDWYEEMCRDFYQRYGKIQHWRENYLDREDVKIVHQDYAYGAEQLLGFEKHFIEQHGEGICIRHPMGKYKFGRSTLKEGLLIKHCRRVRDEATVIGFTESLDQEGNPKGCLGALVVTNKAGQTVPVGTGFTSFQRNEIWQNQNRWLGVTIVYSSKAHGAKVFPRQPSFIGQRNKLDIL